MGLVLFAVLAGCGAGNGESGPPGSGGAGSGGATATGGVGGIGGGPGLGGAGAAGGASGMKAAAGSSGPDAGAVPTFSAIYQGILLVSCSGSQCHNPGSRHGVSFASQSSAYPAVFSRVMPGNANGSSLYGLLSAGVMPPSDRKLAPAQLSEIAAWIDAGASND